MTGKRNGAGRNTLALCITAAFLISIIPLSQHGKSISRPPAENADSIGIQEAVMTPHEVPLLKQPLDGGEPEETPDTSTVTFKATTSNVTKTFAPISQMSTRASYSDWRAVGAEVEWGSLKDYKPQKDADGYYLIESPEALAWISYMIDEIDYYFVYSKIRLTKDIDMSGKAYTGASSVNSDFSNCLRWVPLGGNQGGSDLAGSATFKGEFDGQGHKITNLYVNKGDNSFHAGLI